MERVKRLRKEVGMKQYILAEKLGIEQSNFANIENGRWIPGNIRETEERAVKILKPLLTKKILEVREYLNRLENLSL